MNAYGNRIGKRKIEEESLEIENKARGGQCHVAVPPMYFVFSPSHLGLLTTCRKGRGDEIKVLDRQTNKLITKRAVDPDRLEGKRNNSNERDGEQGSGRSASALLSLQDQVQTRAGDAEDEPLTALIKAMV